MRIGLKWNPHEMEKLPSLPGLLQSAGTLKWEWDGNVIANHLIDNSMHCKIPTSNRFCIHKSNWILQFPGRQPVQSTLVCTLPLCQPRQHTAWHDTAAPSPPCHITCKGTKESQSVSIVLNVLAPLRMVYSKLSSNCNGAWVQTRSHPGHLLYQ